MNPSGELACRVRPLGPGDDVHALTALLHRAYAPLGAAGMNFTAVDQGVDVTRARLASGQALVAVDTASGRPVGTVLVAGAFDPDVSGAARVAPWYFRDDLAHVHQFAVEPAWQGRGVGAALMAEAERRARTRGAQAMLLDTAEPAQALRARYRAAGYADLGRFHWHGKTYRSVLMAKPLHATSRLPRVDDAAHAVAVVRAVVAATEARDWACLRALLHDDARMHWPATGEWFDDADAIVRVQAVDPEGRTLRRLEDALLLDGRVVLRLAVRHGGDRFLAVGLWRVEGGRVRDVVETWSTCEPPPAWRDAATLGAWRVDGEGGVAR